MKVKLVWITPNAESVIGYCARVSNPANQNNPDVVGLLKYCINNKHWSIFEMASMCIEIETSRAISAQILRHKSFSFQELSQRYAAAQSFEEIELRRQDTKNRQNSLDDLPKEVVSKYKDKLSGLLVEIEDVYNDMLKDGIAKESARMILPMTTTTKLYMSGTIRSWIHYLDLRKGNGTQKEHKDIVDKIIEEIFQIKLPNIAAATGLQKTINIEVIDKDGNTNIDKLPPIPQEINRWKISGAHASGSPVYHDYYHLFQELKGIDLESVEISWYDHPTTFTVTVKNEEDLNKVPSIYNLYQIKRSVSEKCNKEQKTGLRKFFDLLNQKLFNWS